MEGWMIFGIALLVAGFLLIAVEMLIPGFGLPGISGIICLVAGIIMTADTVEQGLTITVVVIVLLAVMMTVIMTVLKKVKPPIVLQDEMNAENGYLNTSDLEYLVGKEGVASTDLKPAGKCNVEGVEFDVRAESRYVVRGTKVQINRVHENTLMVREM